ncbi:hypothetical protein VPH35_131306 [Triticum aestivum]|uniref:DUF4220 domain-containing protein n=2 Tax=Triticum TaxID=4564 RepID=A0A9R1AB71_TRITD|nr:uncharacterized protein LOC123160690 [Triticum aestivum]VAI91481.1 unnamed protein product [Triticum turgidum subsp. durum]
MGAGGLVVEVWKEWGIQILVVLSFVLQLVLLVFAGVRRRKSSAALMILLWLAYLMADNVAVYALGHISLDNRPHEDGLVAFWAPFFLLHLGGQDTITAYSLEDNQLWRRHLLTLLVQASGTGYALYRYIPGTPTLVAATVLIFVVGFLKYGERVWALERANIETLDPLHHVLQGTDARLYSRGVSVDAEEELLLDAHYMFGFCKSAFLNIDQGSRFRNANFAVGSLMRSRLFNRGMYMYDLVEAELSIMYDLLYTKAPVIHTWQGCSVRAVAPVATVAAFFLFHLDVKASYGRVDVAITYLLLVGAVALEITSVLRALGSTWTCAYLDSWEFDETNVVIMRLRRLVNAGSKRRRWLHSVGQHNVLDYCCRDPTELRGRVMEAVRLGGWWKKLHFSRTIPISDEFKELVIVHIAQKMRFSERWDLMEARGSSVLADAGMMEDVGWSVGGRDFAECIFFWHIASDIYLRCHNHNRKEHTREDHELAEAIKVLSNYMGFLLLVRPGLLPGGVRRNFLSDSSAVFEKMWRFTKRVWTKDEVFLDLNLTTEEFCRLMLKKHGDGHDKGDTAAPRTPLSGVRLASKLLRNEWKLPNMLQVIFGVWMEFLCYAAHHSTEISHCRQLGSGGDFLTVTRLLLDHYRLFNTIEGLD